jgi:formate--tetrahydrofolate ligase
MTDIQIAQQAAPLPIGDIAAACGIDPQYLEQYGRYKAKIDYRLLRDRAGALGRQWSGRIVEEGAAS